MAEVLVSVAAKVASLVVQNAVASAAGGRRRLKVRIMARKLGDIIPDLRAVLEDAEKRQVNDPRAKEWLERIKDVNYEVVDLLEEFSMVEMKLQEGVHILGLPLSLFNPLGQRGVLDGVVQKMEGMMDEIEALLGNKDVLGLRESSTEAPAQSSMVRVRQERPATTSLFEETATIYGRDDESRALISKLLNEGSHPHQDIQCISIVGMGGTGKTTLAKLVCNSTEVRRYFDFLGWSTVSKEFNLLRIAESMVMALGSKVDEVELESLLQRIRQSIGGRRCLFVLDDVWNADNSEWKQLKGVFNCGAPGSAILITTRDRQVADIAGSRPEDIIALNALSDDDCWSIIRDLAFDTSIDPPDIENIFNIVGRDIAEKCHGNPIVAKSLGGILRGRASIQEWQELLTSEVWDLLPMASSELTYSLMLSYYFLPSVLRQCLLYCSIFPQNYYIDVDKLVKLWMAHGFVAADQDEMEREGWRCFTELLDRSFFQEFKKDDNGNFKCKLEGAMSDFVQFLAKNECHILHLGYKKELGDIPQKARHCTLNVAAQASLPVFLAHTEKLHTLMILSEYSSTDPTTLNNLLSHMRRLRTLDLSFCSMKELPLKVGELLHLRYLDLSFNRDLKKLPKAICNLLNLQTLNLNGCDDLLKLPKGIGKLTQLRHLEILWTTNLSYLPKGIASLTSLRTLSRFFGSSGVDSRACDLADLEELNFLQGSISIDGLGGETGVFQAEKACLKNKKHLRGLELWFSVVESESGDQDQLKALEAPLDLECLGIFNYRGMFFPDWMTALKNLTHLMLADCSKCEKLPPLGKLTSLESLEIKNMSNVETVGSEFLGLNNAVGGEEGSPLTIAFPKLKKLHFHMLGVWKEWIGMTGNGGHANIMPSLSSLSIVSCAKIRSVPNYIEGKQNLSTDYENSPFLKGKAEEDE